MLKISHGDEKASAGTSMRNTTRVLMRKPNHSNVYGRAITSSYSMTVCSPEVSHIQLVPFCTGTLCTDIEMVSKSRTVSLWRVNLFNLYMDVNKSKRALKDF